MVCVDICGGSLEREHQKSVGWERMTIFIAFSYCMFRTFRDKAKNYLYSCTNHKIDDLE